jgi:hypothetical protein
VGGRLDARVLVGLEGRHLGSVLLHTSDGTSVCAFRPRVCPGPVTEGLAV